MADSPEDELPISIGKLSIITFIIMLIAGFVCARIDLLGFQAYAERFETLLMYFFGVAFSIGALFFVIYWGLHRLAGVSLNAEKKRTVEDEENIREGIKWFLYCMFVIPCILCWSPDVFDSLMQTMHDGRIIFVRNFLGPIAGIVLFIVALGFLAKAVRGKPKKKEEPKKEAPKKEEPKKEKAPAA